MHYESILFTVEGGVATLTLNRPARLNCFTAAMHEELRHALDIVRNDAGVRVLVLTGAGRAFCAGQDLADDAVAPGSDAPDLGSTVKQYYAPLVLMLRALPVPVLCAVNGVAAGAGANLAFACDIVLATESASFIQPFCKLGLVPDTGGTYFLPRLAGSARAMGLALLGDKLSAQQAEQWGLIWKCVPDGELQAQTASMAQHFASAPTAGLARTKQALYASATNSLEEQLMLEAEMMTELGRTEDYAEGVAAFNSRRTPLFKGR